MIIDTTKTEQGDKLLKELNIWRRDAKKFNQTALYDLLSDTVNHIKKCEKSMKDEGKSVKEGFTWNVADKAFSDFIRKRANYCCERCGKEYEPNSNSLQCSHHFSRRYHNIRYDPDNALALCYHCHVFWYQKDIPEAARWLEDKIGKDKIDRLIALKNQKQTKHTQSQLDEISKKFQELCHA